MRPGSPVGRAAALAGAACAALAAAGCPSHVDQPDPGDTSPPVVTLDVDQLPGEGLLTVGSQPEDRSGLPRTVRLGLIAVARDGESGVAQVRLTGHITTVCREPGGGDLGQDKRAAVLHVEPTTATTGTGGQPDRRVAQLTVAFPYSNCDAGLSPVGMRGDIHVEGRNGAGASARNADFTFSYS
ncbi:MAG TPA: hypothetical protein VKB57_02500 [Acidimicrobiales bacterium]|nr:hypothetical protein [Acidimicrobiales bacterium]